MKYFLRKIIMSWPLLYWGWFKLYRSKNGLKINFIDRNTTFLIDGYPRSGNTFAVYLLKKIYKSENFCHHYHAIAPLRIALKMNIKSIVIVRDPLNAIASYYLKRYEFIELPKKVDTNLLKMLIFDYIHYYEFIYKNKRKILIVDFRDLINFTEETVFEIDLFLKNLSGLEESFLKNIIFTSKAQSFGSKSVLGSSKPNSDKEILKISIKKKIESLDEFSRCKNVYSNLCLV